MKKQPEYMNSDMKRLYNEGFTVAEIAQSLDWTEAKTTAALGRAVNAGLIERRVPKYTESELEKIKTLRTNGATVRQIADAIGRSVSAVTNRISAMGLAQASVPWTPERDAQLKALYGKHTNDAAADIMGIGVSAFKARASRIGLTATRRMWTADQDEWLKANYMDRTATDLGREIGFNAETVKKHATRLGLTGQGKKRGGSVAGSRPRPKARPTAELETIPLTARPLLEHRKGQCRFPYGERFNVLFCCAPAWKEGSYCEAHAAVCYDYTKRAA